jgi:hypothetical protein
MGFSSPDPPKEDPAVKAARRRERIRAEQEKQQELQEQLRVETALVSSQGGSGKQSLLSRGTRGFSGNQGRQKLGGGS